MAKWTQWLTFKFSSHSLLLVRGQGNKMLTKSDFCGRCSSPCGCHRVSPYQSAMPFHPSGIRGKRWVRLQRPTGLHGRQAAALGWRPAQPVSMAVASSPLDTCAHFTQGTAFCGYFRAWTRLPSTFSSFSEFARLRLHFQKGHHWAGKFQGCESALANKKISESPTTCRKRSESS